MKSKSSKPVSTNRALAEAVFRQVAENESASPQARLQAAEKLFEIENGKVGTIRPPSLSDVSALTIDQCRDLFKTLLRRFEDEAPGILADLAQQLLDEHAPEPEPIPRFTRGSPASPPRSLAIENAPPPVWGTETIRWAIPVAQNRVRPLQSPQNRFLSHPSPPITPSAVIVTTLLPRILPRKYPPRSPSPSYSRNVSGVANPSNPRPAASASVSLPISNETSAVLLMFPHPSFTRAML